MGSNVKIREAAIKLKELKERDLIMREKAYKIVESRAEKYMRHNSVEWCGEDIKTGFEGLLLVMIITGILVFTLAPFIY